MRIRGWLGWVVYCDFGVLISWVYGMGYGLMDFMVGFFWVRLDGYGLD